MKNTEQATRTLHRTAVPSLAQHYTKLIVTSDTVCREPFIFPRNPLDSQRRQILRRTELNLPPHITRSITWIAQEANRGYNLTLHNATDNTIHNFPVEFFQGHWYTLVKSPVDPDEYYIFDDNIVEHRQFGTGFPLRGNPYHPDYKPFHITLTPAVTTQGLPSIPEQTKGAGPSNVPHTPSVQSADLHTPRESQPADSSEEGDEADAEQSSKGSPEHPHTPEEADPPTYHPQVPEGHKQLAAPPEVQQLEEELEQLNINVIAAHHLPPILQVLPPDPPQFLAPPAPQIVPIFMANVQQQQQPPPPQQPAPQLPAGGLPPCHLHKQ